jgi:putative NADPH-quinone reductase
MKISVILGHPNRESFNHAIANITVKTLRANGHIVYFHDLYQENFDPVLPNSEIPKGASLNPVIQSYCDEISNSDGIIVIHPNWWGQPPAILKGWIDRVFRPGVAYEFRENDSGEGVPVGLLKARTAMVFNTSNTPEEREIKVFGDPLENIWKDCIFDLCGVKIFYRKMFRIIVTSTHEQRSLWLKEVEETVDRYFPR